MNIKRFFLFILCFMLVERFTYIQTAGFATYKIIHPEGFITNGKNENESAAEAILDQPFYYLGKGVQFYVFESEDGNYVLKFMKHRRLTPKFWLSNKTSQERIAKVINSCQIAYQYLKEETALVAIHLQPGQTTKKSLQIYDKLGIAHLIDLSQTAYVIQKKAALFHETHLNMHTIDMIVDLLEKQFYDGIIDQDACLRNFGFINDQLVKIDIGSFILRPKDLPLKEALDQGTYKLKKKLNDTTLVDYLEQKMEDMSI